MIKNKTFFQTLLLLSIYTSIFAQTPIKTGNEQTIWPEPGATLTGGWLHTLWHQEYPFNASCPFDTVRHGRSLAGCIAIAMAQIIHYHHDSTRIKNFGDPDSYTSTLNNFSFRIDQDCGSYGTYKWPQLNQALQNIRFPSPADSDSGLVDELVYAAGVSVQTNFSADFSQAVEGKIPTALRSCFGFAYSDHMFGSDSTILYHLQRNIKLALPVIVVLTRSNETPHAVVFDGLNELGPGVEDDLYHINYGGIKSGEAFWANIWPPSQFLKPINHGYDKIKSIIVNSAAPMPPPPPPPPPQPPLARFGATPNKGWPYLYVNFKNQCTGTVSHYDWDFGDSSAHEDHPNPTHCYRSPGNYTVTLIVAGPVGCDTLMAVKMITVYDTPVIDTGIKISIDANGTASWGDMDNDADLDLLVLYYSNVYLYRNDQGQLTTIHAIPVNLSNPSVQWIDLDRDNDLDLILIGRTSSGEPKTQIYRNDNSRFSLSDLFLPPIYGVPTWGDYDNDGDLDMAAVTERTSGSLSVWQNTTNGFIKTNALPVNYIQKGWWCDVDHDQDLDLIANSKTLYRNDKGRFSAEQLPWSLCYSLDVDDYDHDGDVDFLISGETATSIYNNTGDIYNAAATDLTDIREGSAVWLDFNNDGRNDILLSGRNSEYTQYFTRLYHGQESGFNQVIKTPLDETPSRGVAIADYDQDGDPDFLTLGDNTTGGTVGKIFMNNSTTHAVIPDVPQNLAIDVIGHTANFSWSASLSSQIGTALTYNLAVGTSAGSSDILSPLSLRNSGKRVISAGGNVWNNKQWRLRLPAGDYYWTVQSVDVNHNGSPFAAEQRFTIPQRNEPIAAPDSLRAEKNADSISLTWVHSRPDEVYRYHLFKIENNLAKQVAVLDGNMRYYSDSLVSQGQSYQYYLIADNWSYGQSVPSPTVTVAFNLPFTCMSTNIPATQNFFQIADVDNDGDMDVLIQYIKNTTIHSIFYNTLGTYKEKTLSMNGPWSNSPPTLIYDFDNDNDLDLIYSIYLYSNSYLIFLRNNLGSFSEITIALTGPIYFHYGAIYTLDVDNDGRLDILVNSAKDVSSGMICAGTTIKNTSSGWRLAISGAMSDYLGEYYFCDYDMDGDQDILLRGMTGSYTTDGSNRVIIVRLFNNHRGQFSLVDSSLLGWTSGQMQGTPSWRDWDLDGDSDIGISQNGNVTLYYNDQGSFTRSAITADVPIPGTYCDLNNDGLQDVIRYESNHYIAYLQTGPGFQKYYSFSTELGISPCVFDYDGDGDQDILLPYNKGTRTTLLRNDTENRKSPPLPPIELTAAAGKDSVVLRWQQTADAALRSNEITYNLRVGLTPGGCEIVSPLADVKTGQRRILAEGNMLHGKIWALYGLAAGTYYWSVQTIDPGFTGGPFAAEQSFSVGPTSAATRDQDEMPDRFALQQNYPNPFNSQTEIRFNLPEPTAVTLTIYDLSGQVIRILCNSFLTTGAHLIKWDGNNSDSVPAASGIYLYRLQAGSYVGMKKMVLVH